VATALLVINPHKSGICGLWKILWETLRVFFNKLEEDLRYCGVFEHCLYKSFTISDMHEPALHSTKTGLCDTLALVNHTFAQIWEVRVTDKYRHKKDE
jgi:hypothetical protein